MTHHITLGSEVDAEVEYLGRVRMALIGHVGSINFTDQANIRQVHKSLMNERRNKTTYISNKYKIQLETIQFGWDKFLPTLEKDVPDVLNKVLSCKNTQQHQFPT